MALERLEGVPNPMIIKWIRNYDSILGELITKATAAKTIKHSTILERRELLLLTEKQDLQGGIDGWLLELSENSN